jgi:copper chaperone CopZ
VLQHSEADGAAGRARGRASRFGQWPGRSSLRSSFCIGTGIGAGALAASGGGSGSNGWVGGGSGGGGDGSFGSGGGTAAAANVLGEIAVSDAADALVEEVILLDVGGARPGSGGQGGHAAARALLMCRCHACGARCMRTPPQPTPLRCGAAGMKCGGCVSHVKTILEQQPGVVSASVNLATETALVRIKLPAGSGEKELAQAADKLAQVRAAAAGPPAGRAISAQAPRPPPITRRSLPRRPGVQGGWWWGGEGRPAESPQRAGRLPQCGRQAGWMQIRCG